MLLSCFSTNLCWVLTTCQTQSIKELERRGPCSPRAHNPVWDQQVKDQWHRTEEQVQKHKQPKCCRAERMKKPMFAVPGDSIVRSWPHPPSNPMKYMFIASIVYMGKLRCRDLVNMPKDIQLIRLVWHQGPCSFTPLPINPVYKILIFIPWSSAKCLSPTLLDRFPLSLVCLPSEFIISPQS